MADAPLVTILIPNYNYGRYLDECLSSAVGQTYERLQVIFIDNSSSDDSYEIALRYRARYGDRILVYRNDENLGGSRNCDKASRLMSADSEFHIYLSSDDAFHPTLVSRCMELMTRFPEVGFVLTHREDVDEMGRVQPSLPFYNVDCVVPRVGQMEVFMMAGIGVSTQCFRRRAAELRGHVPDYRFDVAGDWYSNFCLATAGDMGYLKDPLCRYRTHAANVTSGAVRDLTNVLEHYLLIHAFSAIATQQELPTVTARLPMAVAKLGAMCLRYASQLLHAGDPGGARRYLDLAPALKPDLVRDPTWRALRGCLGLAPEACLEKLQEIELKSPQGRLVAYDPPAGSVLL